MAGVSNGSDSPHRDRDEREPVPGSSRDDNLERKVNYRKRKSANLKRKSKRGARVGGHSDPCENQGNRAPSNDDDESTDDSMSSSSSGCTFTDSSESSSSSCFSDKYGLDSNMILTMDQASVMLRRKQPKHKWFMVPELLQRPMGTSVKLPGAQNFQERMYGSLHVVQRLELMYKLEKHTGCVSCVDFNKSGELLASGSDDRTVCLWNWAANSLKCQIRTLHKSNVFQSRFLPIQGHINIITSGRDGQVTHLDIDASGSLRNSRTLARHELPSQTISVIAGSCHCFLSCGEDAHVLSFDIRTDSHKKLTTVSRRGRKVALNSLDCHPMNPNEFVVAGCDDRLRVYDIRNAKKPVWKRKSDDESFASITSAVYNYNGTEIVASHKNYILLWDLVNWKNLEYVHKYIGHRNFATIKQINFFGPKSQYIVSGSDCGNIFFWDKETEVIVQWMPGDEKGIVNCLETHPSVPVLASSGLDDNVKIWVPSSEKNPTFDGLRAAVKCNVEDLLVRQFQFPLFSGVRFDGASDDDDDDDDDNSGRPVPCSPS